MKKRSPNCHRTVANVNKLIQLSPDKISTIYTYVQCLLYITSQYTPMCIVKCMVQVNRSFNILILVAQSMNKSKMKHQIHTYYHGLYVVKKKQNL